MSGDPGPQRFHRFAVVAALVVLVIVASLSDRPSDARRPVPIPDDVDVAQIGAATFGAPTVALRNRTMPVAAPTGAASTTWFCGGAPAKETTLVLTNRSGAARTVTVTSVTSTAQRATRRLALGAHSTRDLPGTFAGPGTLGAIVESRHDGVVATQRVTGRQTTTVASCASTSSESWYFAGGDTQRGATETLALFNPFDDLATADVTFLTPDGFRRPQATQGLAVPGRSVVLVDVGTVQNRRSDLAATVTTRAGRLVAWRHQSFDGTGPKLDDKRSPRGVSLALGSTVPTTRFTFPTAVTGSGVAPRLVLANPGATTATVRLRFALDDAGRNGQPPPATIELPSGGVEVLSSDQLRQVAAGVSFTVSGRVVKGGAVVAELWLDGAAPARGHGSFATMAFGVAATTWVVPVGLVSPVIDQLGIAASDRTARVRLWLISQGVRRRVPLGDQPSVVPISGRVTVDLSALSKGHPGAAVEVASSAPVTVTRLQTGAADRGLVSMPAVPVAGGLAWP